MTYHRTLNIYTQETPRFDSGQVHMIETVKCPVCMFDSEVVERYTMESTNGPVEHIRVCCPQGHRYNMPTALLFGLYEIGEDNAL